MDIAIGRLAFPFREKPLHTTGKLMAFHGLREAGTDGK